MLLVLKAAATQGGAPYGGGELYTKESFLYGRFEVRMKSAEGSGIVSSFFLYNVDQPCVDGISEVKKAAKKQRIFTTKLHFWVGSYI